MSAALGLFRLQQVDSRIDQLEVRLRKIQDTLENDAELQAAFQRLRTAELECRKYEHARRAAEEGAKEKQIKIQQAEASLYGGRVQNPKELQDLQADVTSLKKHLASVEEQELDAMVNLEMAQATEQSAQHDLMQIQSRLGAANGKLLQEQTALSRDVQDLQTERLASVGAVDPAVLRTYETLRQARRGLAIAEVSDNACGACGTTLTAALQQSARHAAELVYCPSCGRILFAR
jgi:uncharacterized protein